MALRTPSTTSLDGSFIVVDKEKLAGRPEGASDLVSIVPRHLRSLTVIERVLDVALRTQLVTYKPNFSAWSTLY